MYLRITRRTSARAVRALERSARLAALSPVPTRAAPAPKKNSDRAKDSAPVQAPPAPTLQDSTPAWAQAPPATEEPTQVCAALTSADYPLPCDTAPSSPEDEPDCVIVSVRAPPTPAVVYIDDDDFTPVKEEPSEPSDLQAVVTVVSAAATPQPTNLDELFNGQASPAPTQPSTQVQTEPAVPRFVPWSEMLYRLLRTVPRRCPDLQAFRRGQWEALAARYGGVPVHAFLDPAHPGVLRFNGFNGRPTDLRLHFGIDTIEPAAPDTFRQPVHDAATHNFTVRDFNSGVAVAVHTTHEPTLLTCLVAAALLAHVDSTQPLFSHLISDFFHLADPVPRTEYIGFDQSIYTQYPLVRCVLTH